MSKRKGFIASGIAAIGLLLSAAAADAQQPQRPLFVPGEIIVKFEDGVGAATKAAVLSRNGVFVIRQLRGIDALYGALPAGIDLMAAKARLESLPQVRYAEPNYYRYINAAPNDPGFPLMWGLDNTGQTGGTPDADIDAPEGWNIETGSHDVILAVIDSGTDIDHEDLAANIYVNPGEYGVAGELANNGIDDDGNGFIDDVRGWDFRSGDNDVRDNSPACVGHGTHTAGTAGAVGNNAVGVTGVARNVSILPIRALGPILGILCGANDADLIDAINYAALMGADVSNNSWGGSGGSKAVRDAIAAARHVFVAAAGNEGNNNDSKPSYPASYKLDNIVAVAATDDNDLLPSFSNYGATSVDLAAPGVDILSTLPGDSYGQLSGTSMATPHVAGVAALVKQLHPAWGSGAVAAAVKTSASQLPCPVSWEPLDGADERYRCYGAEGRTSFFGYGVVDAEAAARR